MNLTLPRRSLLQAAGGLVVTFSLAGGRALARTDTAATDPAVPGNAIPGNAALGKSVAADQVGGFLAIAADGKVTMYPGKVDLGTGVQTALMQIVADELDIPFEQLSVIQGDTALTPDQGPTNGSLSIEKGGMQLRHAAATARRELLRRAAARLGVAEADLRIESGVVHATGPQAAHTTGDGAVSFGRLVGGEQLQLAVDPAAPMKTAGAYRLVGRSVPRVDIPDKVFARFTYMQDFRLPGMLHGRVIRPPAIGATLLSVDPSAVRHLPGQVQVVRAGNFLGVVANSEWAAIKAMQALPVKWSDTANLPDEAQIYDYVRQTPVSHEKVTSHAGDAAATLKTAARRVQASYQFAAHTHGSIGPSCAVAAFADGGVTVWSASQGTHVLRAQLAASLNLPAEKVRCIYLAGAGCYGRNGHEDAASDAVLMARAVGKPVRVQWMRQDEHGWDPKGPPVLIDMQAGLDQAGGLTAWNGTFFYPDTNAVNVVLLGSDLAGLPSDGGMNPGNIINDSQIPYAVANVQTTVKRLASTPLRPSWIRTPGRMQNTFANEAFFDEVAAAIGRDPMEMRLSLINDERGAAVLRLAGTMSGWSNRAKADPKAPTAVGFGLSYLHYELYRTYVAAIAEVEVDRTSGETKVRRFFVAHDCGQIINPDGTRNQIEGNIIQTTSRVMKERVTFDRRMVTSLDWSSYPILTFPEAPTVVIELIDRPDTAPWGVGEASAAVVPAAIANAIHDAVGARVRAVPFTPAEVKAAMQRV
jgi:nicotinate dehydrogenase subunit B